MNVKLVMIRVVKMEKSGHTKYMTQQTRNNRRHNVTLAKAEAGDCKNAMFLNL